MNAKAALASVGPSRPGRWPDPLSAVIVTHPHRFYRARAAHDRDGFAAGGVAWSADRRSPGMRPPPSPSPIKPPPDPLQGLRAKCHHHVEGHRPPGQPGGGLKAPRPYQANNPTGHPPRWNRSISIASRGEPLLQPSQPSQTKPQRRSASPCCTADAPVAWISYTGRRHRCCNLDRSGLSPSHRHR